MNLYTCTTFAGHWPVGTSAIVRATSPELAAKRLEQALKEEGLEQTVQPQQMRLFAEVETVKILNNGEY